MDLSQLFTDVVKVWRLRHKIIFCFKDRSILRMSPKSQSFPKKRLEIRLTRLTEDEINQFIQNPSKEVVATSNQELPNTDVPNTSALQFESTYNGTAVSCIIEIDGLNLTVLS